MRNDIGMTRLRYLLSFYPQIQYSAATIPQSFFGPELAKLKKLAQTVKSDSIKVRANGCFGLGNVSYEKYEEHRQCGYH